MDERMDVFSIYIHLCGQELESKLEISHKCRRLLHEAERYYRHGNYEEALVRFHRGHLLRPKEPKFKTGIAKTEDKLRIIFADNESLEPKSKRCVSVVSTWASSDIASEVATATTYSEKPKRSYAASSISAKTSWRSTRGSTRSSQSNNQLTEHQIQWIKHAISERRKLEKRDLRYRLKDGYNEEIRNIRVKFSRRPKENHEDDYEFLQMLNKKTDNTSQSNKQLQGVTKEAINYLDIRNKYWTEQVPHNLKDKHFANGTRDKNTPLSSSTMLAFAVKEIKRIHTMLTKRQWHRTVDKSKQLLEHLNKHIPKHPSIESIKGNCYSFMGTSSLELDHENEALQHHLSDLQVSSESGDERGKARAWDNIARVYARIGEYGKAVAIWEKKLESGKDMKPENEAMLHYEMGCCYLEIGLNANAKESAEKSLNITSGLKRKMTKLVINANILIAQSLLKFGRAFDSKHQFTQALKLAKDNDDKQSQPFIANALNDVIKFCDTWGDVDEFDFEPPEKLTLFIEEQLKRLNAKLENNDNNQVIKDTTELIRRIHKLDILPDKESKLFECFHMLGKACLSSGDYEQSLAHHIKSLNLATDNELEAEKQLALVHVGKLCARLGDYEKAIEVWDDLSFLSDLSPDEYSWLYYEKGYCHIETGSADIALDYGSKLLQAAEEKNDKPWILKGTLLTAQALLTMGEALKSRREFQKAKKLAEELDDKETCKIVEIALNEIGDILEEYSHTQVDTKSHHKSSHERRRVISTTHGNQNTRYDTFTEDTSETKTSSSVRPRNHTREDHSSQQSTKNTGLNAGASKVTFVHSAPETVDEVDHYENDEPGVMDRAGGKGRIGSQYDKGNLSNES